MNLEDESLLRWIDTYPISRPKRNIYRDFSDAIPLVEILKYHFPKMVEMHNYSPQNSIPRKLSNWFTLNRKVLLKLGIPLTRQTMEQLSRATPGVLEKVMYEVKAKIDELTKEEEKEKEKDSEVLVVEGINNEDSVVPVKVKSGSKVIEQVIVPMDLFNGMKKEIEEKEEEICCLRNKVCHLESMLAIKEERIKDLTDQITNRERNVKSIFSNFL